MPEGSYQVIARRWRPQQFDEIVGQEHIVRTLKNAIETGRIGHAYLFVGPRGTGKTTTARIFAKALNCTGGPSVSPSKDDPICKAIVAGSCMDVIEIDAASNRGIDDAKQIRDECQYAPAECRYKIYIIDEVHQLTKDAFNTLLKILEEPPPHVKFIFATTESDKVMATITSRCQRFEFQPIPEEKIADRLTTIVQADGVNADRAALIAIARLANGGMRDSQSILDQAISFCGKTIVEKDILDIYGLASESDIAGLSHALAAGDHSAVIAYSDKFMAEGRDLVKVLQHAQSKVREALLDAIRAGGRSSQLGAPLFTEQLLHMLETLQAGEPMVRGGMSERAHFEVTLLKALEQSRSRAIDSLIKDLASMAADTPPGAGLKKIRPAQGEPTLPAEPTRIVVPAPVIKTFEVRAEITPTKVSPAAHEPRDQPPPKREPAKPASKAYSREEKPTLRSASSLTSATQPSQVRDSIDEGPPLDSLQAPEDFTDATPAEFLGEETGSPTAVVAGPGDPDFEAAVGTIPDSIRKILERDFRAKFTALGEVKESELVGAASKPARAVISSTDDADFTAE